MPAFILAAVLIAMVATVVLVRGAALRLRDEATRRLPIGPDGLIPGAEPFELRRDANAPSVLLLHGAGDTPQTLRYLAEFLHQRGYNVRVPLLPGHGRSLREFSTVTANEWLQAARSAYRDMTAEDAWVAIVGLSMGGALAAQLAAEHHELPCLALLAPYLAMPRRIAIAARLSRVWNPAVPFVRAINPAARPSIQDKGEASRSLAYGVFTPAALRALHRTVAAAISALPHIASPTLMVQSREDNRVPPDAAQHAFDRIGSKEKQLVWLTGAGHVITVDHGRDRVFELVSSWLDRHRAAQARERRA